MRLALVLVTAAVLAAGCVHKIEVRSTGGWRGQLGSEADSSSRPWVSGTGNQTYSLPKSGACWQFQTLQHNVPISVRNKSGATGDEPASSTGEQIHGCSR